MPYRQVLTAVGDTHTTTIAVNVDDSSIEIDSSNGLQVKASGVTNGIAVSIAHVNYRFY